MKGTNLHQIKEIDGVYLVKDLFIIPETNYITLHLEDEEGKADDLFAINTADLKTYYLRLLNLQTSKYIKAGYNSTSLEEFAGAYLNSELEDLKFYEEFRAVYESMDLLVKLNFILRSEMFIEISGKPFEGMEDCEEQLNDIDNKKTCDNCGSPNGRNNSSDQFICNNCGNEEGN